MVVDMLGYSKKLSDFSTLHSQRNELNEHSVSSKEGRPRMEQPRFKSVNSSFRFSRKPTEGKADSDNKP